MAGAVVPVLVVVFAPAALRVAITVAVTLAGLVLLGTLGAQLGGAPKGRAALRVLVGGSLALLVSLGIGRLTGTAL